MLKWLFMEMISYTVLLLRGGVSYARFRGVQVGDRSRILTTKFGSEPFLVSIGDDVTVASGVRFVNHDGATSLIKEQGERRCYYARIEVGNQVFIGVGSTIMPGVRIADRVIVAAGAVVTKSIPSDSVVGGVPARYICSFQEYSKHALSIFPKKTEMAGTSYRDRVESVLDHNFKQELSTSHVSD